MRDEAFGVIDSVKETIRIGEEGGLPTQVTHHKIVGPANYGKSVETLKLLEAARARGVDTTSDQYPYTASSNAFVASMVPQWAQEGGREQMLARLKNPASRKEIAAETVRIIRRNAAAAIRRTCSSRIATSTRRWRGRISRMSRRCAALEPTIENGAEAALWVVEQGNCQGVYHAMARAGSRAHHATSCHDGCVRRLGADFQRGRAASEELRHVCARARCVCARSQCHHARGRVRKMTSFPAQRLRVNDRGVLRPGMKADIVVFDPARVRDMATFEKPHQYAEGFSSVIVNGQLVFDGKAMTPARPGKSSRK